MDIVKGERKPLRDFGLDEKWLQDQICQDPAILGIPGVMFTRREKNQPMGGRIDIILTDEDNEIRYEVEVMLGRLDPSHIIRCVEYWDIERTRSRQYEHRAVIIAEDITSRFFNVIWLLNRAVPIIAIQLQAINVEGKLLLNFTKILDISELGEQDESPANESQPVDRPEWEKRAPGLLGIADKLVSYLHGLNPEVRYNRSHIAVRTTGVQFAWLFPRVYGGLVQVRMLVEERADWLVKLEDARLLAKTDSQYVKLRLGPDDLSRNEELISGLIKRCEELSR
jgi:hypothetical protein